MDNCAEFCSLSVKVVSCNYNKCIICLGGIVIGIFIRELLDFVVNYFDALDAKWFTTS